MINHAADQYAWSSDTDNGPGKKSLDLDKEKEEEESPRGHHCTHFVNSQAFDMFMAVIVLMNVVLLSVETDATGESNMYKRANEGFLLIYILELIMRFLRNGGKMFEDRLIILDVFLVVCAFIDRLASERGLARSLPVLRLVRIFRLLSTVPYLRDSRELKLLVGSSTTALTAILWVTVLLFVILWSIAMWTKVVFGESPAWNGSMDPFVQHEAFASFDNRQYFGSVPRSLLTLLQVTTLSQWADNVARPILEVYPVAFIFFVFLLLLITYGLILCIVSIIVQDAVNSSKRLALKVDMASREVREKRAQRATIKVFQLVDKNGDGKLTTEELQMLLDSSDLREVLKELDVPVSDAEGLTRLFDRNGDGVVDQEEFMRGIACMQDDIQPRDFVVLSIWVWNLMMKARLMECRLRQLQQDIINLRQKLEIGFTALHRFLATYQDTSLRQRAIKAISTAEPDMPPEASLEPPPPSEDPEPPDPGHAKDFAQLLMPRSTAWVKALPRRPRITTKWVTVMSPFSPIRDKPNIAGNHIGALRPGDLFEFDDIHGEPVLPEDLSEYPFLKGWKLDKDGKRGIFGYVVPYTPSRGAHFVPSEDYAASQAKPDADEVPVAGELMAPVTVATPPRIPSPDAEGQVLARRPSKRMISLGQAPPPRHIAEMLEADEKVANEDPGEKYGLQQLRPSPNLTNLKELLT